MSKKLIFKIMDNINFLKLLSQSTIELLAFLYHQGIKMGDSALLSTKNNISNYHLGQNEVLKKWHYSM